MITVSAAARFARSPLRSYTCVVETDSCRAKHPRRVEVSTGAVDHRGNESSASIVWTNAGDADLTSATSQHVGNPLVVEPAMPDVPASKHGNKEANFRLLQLHEA
jgi:hypothetical protein